MSPDAERLAQARRREATRAAIRYFALFFALFLAMGALTAYTLISAREDRQTSRAIRMEYCQELERLKAQNREDLARDKRNFRRNLRLLGIRETPELRKAAREEWARKAARNRPKSCPYTGDE